MSPRSWLRSWLSRQPHTHAPRLKHRLSIERLDDRIVPSTLSVSDVTVREGPTSLGVLGSPSGSNAVGTNGIRGIAFNTVPGHPHFGDLFVTGWMTHSVARFDWESQTYQPFVAPDSGGLGEARGIAVGPDGNVYVTGMPQHSVLRYDGATGDPLPAAGQPGAVFIPAGSGGLSSVGDVAFGPDGNVYVCSGNTNQILEYQGPAGPSPGSFVGVFVSITNASSPSMLTFGPDGNLYVSLYNANVSPDPYYGQVNRYDGATGAPIGTGVFVSRGSGGLIQPRGIVFDPTGTDMYVVHDLTGNGFVSDLPGTTGQVLRYQGPAGANPGAYVEAYITGGQAGLDIPIGLARDAAGNLYVGDRDTPNVKRFAPGSQATFTVSLDAPSDSPVSVDYATAAATAAAGSDYTQSYGTLTFTPGETTKTVVVSILDDQAGEPTETFQFNLVNALNATIADGQGVATVLDNETKFFVVDSDTVKTYEYSSGGTSEEITVPQGSSNTAPRGAASTAAGTTVWVVDANRRVYVYNTGGVQIGSWSAGGGLSQPEGITVSGNDVWIVDAKNDRVYRFANAAGRMSGSQNPAGNFRLASGNTNPKDLVTDGTSLWVVNDSTTDKVFKYTLSGSLLGSWTIDPANASPTGLTLDPADPRHLWVVDNGTDRVYQYNDAVTRTAGSQAAAASFALNPFNTNPQGIADPPAPAPVGSGTQPPDGAVVPGRPRRPAAPSADGPARIGADWFPADDHDRSPVVVDHPAPRPRRA